jgi:hypothetical protein
MADALERQLEPIEGAFAGIVEAVQRLCGGAEAGGGESTSG